MSVKRKGLQIVSAEVAKYEQSEGREWSILFFVFIRKIPGAPRAVSQSPLLKLEAVAPFEHENVGCCPCLRCIFMLQCSQCVVGGIYIYIYKINICYMYILVGREGKKLARYLQLVR